MSTTETPLQVAPLSMEERPKRVLARYRESDVLALVGAFFSAAGLTWLLFTQIAPFNGKVGALAVGWVLFVVIYGLLVSLDEDGQAVRDRVASVVVHSLALLLLTVLVFVIAYVISRGATAMVHWNFFVKDLSTTGPLDPLSLGGIGHAIVGTLIMISLSLAITVPLGLTCAVFLAEFPGPFARTVRTVVEAMTALPSIVAGLFVYTVFILMLHVEKSGFAAALALSVMMFSIIIRAADVVLRLVPGSLTEASLALGADRWRTVWHVTLPTARSGLATAVILGTARGIGETSPVLLTAGYATSYNFNPFSGPMTSLPLAAYTLRSFPQPGLIARGFGSAATLMVIVLVLFIVARWLGGRGPGVLSPRQSARRAEQSLDDAYRIASRSHAAPGAPR
ncbi:phosphate ABC transporter permease PstA [Spongisporangium articulatum]|uniref:Phosphate transport system permease protein PstA n=1 Tax=Spongisporangium articulatum TaxID=3362603 RepID=A0ABW8AIX5_9ACTN